MLQNVLFTEKKLRRFQTTNHQKIYFDNFIYHPYNNLVKTVEVVVYYLCNVTKNVVRTIFRHSVILFPL